MPERYDEHYVRSVVWMGDGRHVFTNQAIFTTNRIKLVDKGARINSELFERLASHKLIPKLDECLSVDNEITQENLMEHARELLAKDHRMSVINQESRTRDKLLRAIGDIVIIPPLAFKLTVAKDQRPEIYDHSIRVALIALFLAIKSYFFSQKELVSFAAAAIFHDLGILHIPPDLLEPARKLGKSERHYLYAHPITGFLLLRKFPEYHPEISRTVFEHHERLDGSGYPRGLKADEICLGAQILMLAEVANTVFERSATTKAIAKLSILLRINRQKFNADLANRLITTLQGMVVEDDQTDDEVDVFCGFASFERSLSEIEQVFQSWYEMQSLFRQTENGESQPLLSHIISDRIQKLQHSLSYAGFDLQDTKVLTELGRQDQDALLELSILVGETRWQLSEIIHEANRRLGDPQHTKEVERTPLMRWIERSEDILSIH